MKNRWNVTMLLAIAVLAGLATSFAQDSEEKKEEGGLFPKGIIERLKEKAPEGVSESIKGGIGDLQKKLRENLDALKKLQTENADLKVENQSLKDQVLKLEQDLAALEDKIANMSEKTAAQGGAALADAKTTAAALSQAYATDSRAADEAYFDTYVTLTGRVKKFKAGSGAETFVFLVGEKGGPSIMCSFYRDADFAIDTLEHEGRMVNKADGTTFLAIGQNITVKGTCKGKGIDVELRNCVIDGMKPKPLPKKEEPKRR